MTVTPPTRIRLLIAICLLAGIVLLMALPMKSSQIPEIHISRQQGFILGTRIQGHLTLQVKLPQNIQNASLLLNGETIQSTSTESMSYTFQTANIGHDWLNATVQYTTQAGNRAETSKIYQILESKDSFLLASVMMLGILAILALFVRFGIMN